MQTVLLLFFLGTSPFCFCLWLCALVIWPTRLYSGCEAGEQKDGCISFCARPQAKTLLPLLPITSKPDSASRQDAAPFLSSPDQQYSRGVEVSGRPTSEFGNPEAFYPFCLSENLKEYKLFYSPESSHLDFNDHQLVEVFTWEVLQPSRGWFLM